MLRILQKFILIISLTVVAALPSHAMFVQPDWLDPTEPGVGTNRYAYSGNDPVNRIDPLGNSWLDRGWDNVFGNGSFNNTFGDSGSAWSDRNFGNPGEIVTGHFYSNGNNENNAPGGPYANYKSENLDKNTEIARIGSLDAIKSGDGFIADVALIASGTGLMYKGGRATYGALKAAQTIATEKTVMAAAANVAFKSTAQTVAGRALTKHPNVVGFKTGVELSRAYRSPQALNEAANKAISNMMVNGTRSVSKDGQVVSYTLSSGIGVRFDAVTNAFSGFLGRGL